MKIRSGGVETEGILDGTCVIQEKIDSADAPIWHDLLVGKIYEISKKVPKLNFKACKRTLPKKAKMLYFDLIK